MVLFSHLPLLLAGLTGLVASQGNGSEPLQDNGLTNLVQWQVKCKVGIALSLILTYLQGHAQLCH